MFALMGHTPIPRVPPPTKEPTRESFHLGRAREAYVAGTITLERFEELAGHVLTGGHLSQALELGRAMCRHDKNFDVHCMECQMAGYCACEDCERDG